MKYLIISIISCYFLNRAVSQTVVEPSPIKWYTLEEAVKLNEKQKRIIMIDFYTDWCGWCTRMMQTTFANKHIANYINNQFYPVRFDAETHDTILYEGKKWSNNGVGKRSTHDLAKELLNNRLSYPTIVYLLKDGTNMPVPGYLDVKQYEPLMYFLSEDMNNNCSFDVFDKYFKITYLPKESELKVDSLTSGKINWLSFEQAEKAHQKLPKKILVSLEAKMYVGNHVMSSTTYTNPLIANYINNNYYAVKLNAASQDTIRFMGQVFVNKGKGDYALHSLAAQLVGQNIMFPTVCFFDEQKRFINRIQAYIPPESFEPFLKYVAENHYLTTKWDVFMRSFKSSFKK